MFADSSVEETDPYWPIIGGINGFNANRKDTIAAGQSKAMDESMCPYMPSHHKTGNLPNISFILRKPCLLGVKLKTAGDGRTVLMLYMEVQQGKSGMKTQ